MRPPTACRGALRQASSRSLRPRAAAAAGGPASGRALSTAHPGAAAAAFPRRASAARPAAAAAAPPRARGYHAYDRPAGPGAFSAAERAILSAAYARVPRHGFTAEALALGARDAGLLDISAALVPAGAFGLVRWHLASQREALAGRAAELFAPAEARLLSPAERAEALAWERLLGNRVVLGRWQEALAIMAQPSYVPASLKELAELADEIWFLAGDVSVDPSWYTKRASLSTIYAAAELFMTNDHSPDFQDTREFLRRRFGEANELGGAVRSFGQWLGFTANAGLNVLRSKGMPV